MRAPSWRWRSSGPPLQETEPGEGGRRVGLQPRRLGGQLPAALGRESVVAAQAVLYDLLPVDADQPIEAQAVQGRIQGPSAQPHASIRDPGDIGDDPVSVL